MAAAAAVGVAGMLALRPPSGLALASTALLATCIALTVVERVRCDDWLNGATFLLVPVALGFGLRGLFADLG